MSSPDKYQNQIPQDSLPPKKPEQVSVANPQEMPGERSFSVNNLVDNPGSFLFAMMQLSPFFAHFEYISGRCYGGKALPAKVGKLKAIHPWWFRVSVVADFIVRVCAVGVLLSGATWALYKMLR